jgi:hypothetical protein
MKKKTLGSNPLEAYLTAKTVPEKRTEADKPADMYKKQRITIHLPVHLIDRIKNIVFWEPGMTVTTLAEQAFEQLVSAFEKKRGEPYPERKEKTLKGGRPLS